MWDPGSEAYLQGRAELVGDVAQKRVLWGSGQLPYDPAGFFGAPDNPDLVLVRVHPERATVMADGARHRWTR